MNKLKNFLKNKKEVVRVEAKVMPEGANGMEKLKLSNFILETERITKEAKELNDRLKYNITEDKTCKITFNDKTGTPAVELNYSRPYSYNNIKLELDEVRNLIIWLKDRGIG